MFSVFVLVSTIVPYGTALATYEIKDLADRDKANAIAEDIASKATLSVSISTWVIDRSGLPDLVITKD